MWIILNPFEVFTVSQFRVCTCNFFRFQFCVSAFRRKVRKANINYVMSVCPSAWSNSAPTVRIFMKFTIWIPFPKSVWKVLRFNKIWEGWQVLYMKTNIHFWSYLAHFFLEWEIFQTKVVEKIKTHILCSVTFFRKSYRLWDNVEKYCTAGQATDGNMAHAHCMMDT